MYIWVWQGNGIGKDVVFSRNHVKDITINSSYLLYNGLMIVVII